MTKSAATAIANHLHGEIFASAGNSSGKTWGFKVAVAPGDYTIVELGDYRALKKARARSRQDMIETLLSGDAPDWMSLEFKW